MELVRQPHPKLCLLSAWLDEGMWLGVNFKATDRKTDSVQWNLRESGYGTFSEAEIEAAVADESCARWHELVAVKALGQLTRDGEIMAHFVHEEAR